MQSRLQLRIAKYINYQQKDVLSFHLELTAWLCFCSFPPTIPRSDFGLFWAPFSQLMLLQAGYAAFKRPRKWENSNLNLCLPPKIHNRRTARRSNKFIFYLTIVYSLENCNRKDALFKISISIKHVHSGLVNLYIPISHECSISCWEVLDLALTFQTGSGHSSMAWIQFEQYPNRIYTSFYAIYF